MYGFVLQKKFEGTRVTIENFLAWKAKFDAEMVELNKKKLSNDPMKNKLTGAYDKTFETLDWLFT